MKKEKGFIAIVTILMVSALILVVSFSVASLAISQLQGSFAQTNGEDKWYLTDGCVEDALLKLRASASYSGGTISRPEGTCSVRVSQAGSVYTLTVNTSSASYNRTVLVTVTRGSGVTVSGWREI